MEAELKSKLKDEDIVSLETSAGDSLIIHLHGATVLSWKTGGEEVLFLSKQAVFDNKKAIRGGIPLVFPQFGPWSCGPQHGFARIKRWNLESAPQKGADGSATCALSLDDDEDTRASWDYRFKLVYTLTMSKSCLTMTLAVNNTGDKPFDFTTLMHTYFRTPDIAKTVIRGLKNLNYIDKVKDGNEFKEEREEIVVPENYDRVYQKCPDTVSLETEKHTAEIKLSNFTDVVVWNPWVEKAKGMSDFGDEEYTTMVCVEAGSVSTPVTIDNGKSLTFSQTVSITSKL